MCEMQAEAVSKSGAPCRRVLVFRAAEDAARTAQALTEAGYSPVIEPLFTIVASREAAPSGTFDATLLASAHAVPFLSAMRELPVFAVGSQTAKAAREAGHHIVHAAEGDRWALVRLVRGHAPPKARLLAVIGQDRHEDWLQALADDGYVVSTWTAYQAVMAERLPVNVEALMASPASVLHEMSALHFSARSAAAFATLAEAAGVAGAARQLNHIAVSDNVAAPLAAAGCERLHVARTPDMAGMLDALRRCHARPDGISRVHDQAASYRNPERRVVEGAMSALEMDRVTSKASVPAEDVAKAEPSGVGPDANTGAATPVDGVPARPDTLPPQDVSSDQPPSVDVAPMQNPAPRRAGPGWGGLILSGVLGGIVGAGGVYEAQNMFGSGQEAPRAAASGTATTSSATEQRVAALEARLSQAQDQAAKAMTAAEAASRKVEAVAAAMPAAGGAPVQSGNGQAATANLAGANLATAPEIKALAERLARLETGSAQSGAAAEAILPRLAGLEAATRNIGIPSAQASAATQLLLVDRIRLGLDAGQGIDANVRGLAAAGVPADRLAAIATMGARPGATRAALQAEFARARRALSEDNAAAPASWSDKALALAGRIVTVQRIDATGPVTPPVLAARIEAALASRDFAAAHAAWKALPEPNRRASEALGAALGARADADAALAGIDAAAVAALTAR